jgi:D-arabinose 1-dehydrogenase-like Zn-dependent alcohol dehydrogenase
MVAIPSGLVSIPDDLNSIDAAPLLCAGLTTYNALRHSSAEPGVSAFRRGDVYGVWACRHL